MQDAHQKQLEQVRATVDEKLLAAEGRIRVLSEANERRFAEMNQLVDGHLKGIKGGMEASLGRMQDANEKKLEQMRETVDEKLQSTLERRLGESFKLVRDQLEAVEKGLGAMRSIGEEVGDLSRTLTNVKTRGTFGECQAGDILEQVLTPDQFERSVKVQPKTADLVDFAVRLPGKGDGEAGWLPIDAKFPQEDYQRLLDAHANADDVGVRKSAKALGQAIELAARSISEKYIAPPHTTDFAIMFLPTEGLYAEVLRQPGIIERLQQQYRVVIAGPTTLAATLSSLKMGFRTLAIEQRSSEVWAVLSGVKSEWDKFGRMLAGVKKQLITVTNKIDGAEVRHRGVGKALSGVESLTDERSMDMLDLPEIDAGESSVVGASTGLF